MRAGWPGVCSRFSTSWTPCTWRALPTSCSIISAESASPRRTTLPFSAFTSILPFGTSGSRKSSLSTLRASVTSSGWALRCSRRWAAFFVSPRACEAAARVTRLPCRRDRPATRSSASLRRRLPLSGSKKYARAAPSAANRSLLISALLVAPVEVARTAPKAFFLLREVLLCRPGERNALRRDGGLLAVHRLLDAGLLLGLEERMVLERILGLVSIERQVALELRVPLFQLEVVLDDLGKERRGLHRRYASRGSLGKRGRLTPTPAVGAARPPAGGRGPRGSCPSAWPRRGRCRPPPRGRRQVPPREMRPRRG